MTNNKGFTLKDIKGAVVEKKLITLRTTSVTDLTSIANPEDMAFNEGVDAQSSVRLRMNREKLIQIIESHFGEPHAMDGELADQIIANQLDIIEVCNDQ